MRPGRWLEANSVSEGSLTYPILAERRALARFTESLSWTFLSRPARDFRKPVVIHLDAD